MTCGDGESDETGSSSVCSFSVMRLSEIIVFRPISILESDFATQEPGLCKV